MYRESRKACGLSIEDASFRVHVAPRTLSIYEAGERTPPPEVVLEMSRAYGCPSMTQAYCRESCAIGQAYSYVLLDNINSDLPSIALKLLGEMAEAQTVMQSLLTCLVNRNGRDDFTAKEWNQFCSHLHEFLDVEHNIEILKLALGRWTDVSQLIAQHNQKCRDRGYIKKETA